MSSVGTARTDVVHPENPEIRIFSLNGAKAVSVSPPRLGIEVVDET